MSFLPDDYEAPKSNSPYMKLQDGENRIRIISSPIIGWEDWKDKKPVRFRRHSKPAMPIDPAKPIKHFWAMLVWDYNSGAIKILELTQSSVLRRLEELAKDAEWGSPYHYDIKIVKTGKDKMTNYAVNPSPARELDGRIKEAFYARPIDIEELFNGGDPMAATETVRTKAFWEMPAKAAPSVSPAPQAEELLSHDELMVIEKKIAKEIDPKDPFWRDSALKALKIDSFTKMPRRLQGALLRQIEAKAKSLLETTDDVPF